MTTGPNNERRPDDTIGAAVMSARILTREITEKDATRIVEEQERKKGALTRTRTET